MILNHCRLISELSGGISTKDGSVVFEDGEIISVSEIPSNAADAVDCQGMTLLPGLIDLHTHLGVFNPETYKMLHCPMKLLKACVADAQRYLSYGFTTIRDCSSPLRAANDVRDMISEGLCKGPDIISSGLVVLPTYGNSDDPGNASVSYADGKEEFWKKVRLECAEGADFIKIYASGSAFLPSGIPTQAIMREEEIVAAVEAAKMHETYVAAHCHDDNAIRTCILSGVKTLEHATYLGEDTLDLILNKDNCYIVPTLAPCFVSQTGSEREFWLKKLAPMQEAMARGIGMAYRAGAKLGFGTDAAAGSKAYDQGIEFKYRKELCGMEDLDILLQATKNNAEIAGIGNRKGQLAAGFDADMILVSGKPDEDILCMCEKPVKVWKNGVLV